MSKVEPNSQPRVQMEWLDVRELTQYACVSERTLREWIHRPENPLPAVQVGNKLLVSKSAFDQWMMAHPVPQAETMNIIVDDVMRRIRG